MSIEMREAARTREIFEKTGGVRIGHFLVPAGHHTGEFWEKFAVLQQPSLASDLISMLARRFRTHQPEFVAGPSQGGLILAYELARQLGCNALFLERDALQGPFVVRRGTHVPPATKVVVVDDLVSSGRTLNKVLTVLASFVTEIVGIGVLVDRRSGIPQEERLALPPIQALLEVRDPPSYPPSRCPYCAAGKPLLDPRTLRPLAS